MSDNDKKAVDFEKSKAHFDYAWKWFAYHADQRMKAFNFMLITFGILTTAIVSAIDKKISVAAEGLCVASVALALLFILLDRRNQLLVEVARRELRRIEIQSLYAEFYTAGMASVTAGNGENIGILLYLKHLDDEADSLATFKDKVRVASRHRNVIISIAILFIIIFLALIFVALNNQNISTKVEITLPNNNSGR